MRNNNNLEPHQSYALTTMLNTFRVPVIEQGPVNYLREKIVEDQNTEDYDQARFVLDLSVYAKQFVKWQQMLPRVKPFYAVKCNNHPMILRTLLALGSGFDCASSKEIQQVIDLGADPSDVIFANPCKQISHIKYADKVGITTMTFDSVEELSKIYSHYPKAQLVLRIRPDDSRSMMPFGSKFGADTTLKNLDVLIETAQKMGLDIVGVSFHVGSGCTDAAAYSDAVQLARECWDTLEGKGFSPNLLDIGGGFPGHLGERSEDKNELSFNEIAAALTESLDKFFPPKEGLRIISEPGRYFSLCSQVLACNLYSRRKNNRPTSSALGGSTEPDYLYYINDGAYGAFNNTIFDHARPQPAILSEPTSPDETEERPLVRCRIFGPTCDSLDLVCPEVLLPVLKPGTWLYFPEMGAYTSSASSSFNGFKTKIVHVVYSSS